MTNTIEAEALTRSFGRTQALRGVDLTAGMSTAGINAAGGGFTRYG